MPKKTKQSDFENIPSVAAEFIKLVIKKMGYRKKVRADVQAELIAHFEDELKDCATAEEKERIAKKIIDDFGDVKMLGKLLRRAKKRCRPLWRTITARTFQTVGVLILCFIIYTAWFLTGKPIITTDYIAEFNRQVRPVADESQNAAPFYEKAIELAVERPKDLPKPSSKKLKNLTDEERQKVTDWVTANEKALEQIVLGSKKPYYWMTYSSETGVVMEILMPGLSVTRNLCYALCWRAQFHAEQGRYNDAFNDIKICYRLGQHSKGPKTLIEQLVGMAIEALAVQTLCNILDEYQVDSTTLATLQQDFEQMISGEDFVVRMKTERLFMYDEIQRCFTEDRFGGGHLYLKRIQTIGNFADGLGTVLVKNGWYAPFHVLFTHPNKQQSREMADRFYDFLEEAAQKTPAYHHTENIDLGKQAYKIVKGNILLEILSPALSRVIQLNYRHKTNVQATLAIMAILRYQQDTGRYPENLNKLIEADYLKQMPMDSFSDKSLVYKKTDDGFTLYSVGSNFTDDNGQVTRYTEGERKGQIKKFADEGDWLFWPVEKN